MGYSRKGKSIRPVKRHHLGLIIGVVLLIVCSVSTGLFFILKANKTSPYSYHEPTEEERENNTLQIKSFLGYEFGKTYAAKFEILAEPWFGFTMVEFNKSFPGGPLYSLSFRRKTKDTVNTIWTRSDEEQGRIDLFDLACAFTEKYEIVFSVWEDEQAIYYGKYVEITIKQHLGTLELEIKDIASEKENHELFSEELHRIIEQRKEETRENVKKEILKRRMDKERM